MTKSAAFDTQVKSLSNALIERIVDLAVYSSKTKILKHCVFITTVND